MFVKYLNEKEQVFNRWMKSDMFYIFNNVLDIHSTIIQGIDDEHLEGSGFQFQKNEEFVIKMNKVNEFQASSHIELPEKHEKSQSIISIRNEDQFCFLWCIILAHLHQVEEHKIEIQFIQCI